MARYKHIDRNPRFIPVVLDAQLMAGSFEYALDYLIDHELDLSRFDTHYKNDDTGAPAYAPSVLLKIVLLAYSRAIERACRENVLFMAISGDSAPQFTTIAKFVRELATEIHHAFTQDLLICDAKGVIGRQMFAIEQVSKTPIRVLICIHPFRKQNGSSLTAQYSSPFSKQACRIESLS